MSDFINTIDILGDEAVTDSIIDRSIVEFRDDKLTSVGTYAFQDCTALETVDLPNVTSVTNYSFGNCSKLISLNLPSVTSLAFFPLSGTSSLTTLVLPKVTKIGQQGLNGTSLRVLDLPSCTSIGDYNFSYSLPQCHLILRSETLCAHTRSAGNQGIKYIYVPANLIGSYRGATNWSEYAEQFRSIIPGDEDTLQGIVNETLTDWTNNSVTSIPERAFYKYTPLKTVSSESVTSVGVYAFKSCESLTDLDLPNLVSTASYGECFSGCRSLVNVNLPRLQRFSNGIFTDCTSLKSIYLPEVINNVSNDYGGGHFTRCTALKLAVLPKLETIAASMFNSCSSLEYVDTSSVTSIANWAFERCNSLKGVILRNDRVVASLISSNYPFYGVNLDDRYIYVPSALISAYQEATNWSALYAQYPNLFRALEDYTVDGTITGEFIYDIEPEPEPEPEPDTPDTPALDAEVLYSLPESKTFNGSSDYVDTGIKLFDTAKDFTIVCSADFSTLVNNMCMIHCMKEASPYPGMCVDGMQNAGVRICYTATSGGSNTISDKASVSTLAMRYKSGILDKICYKNTSGELITVTHNSTASYTATTENLILGAYQTTTGTKGRWYRGTINSFVVYGAYLSDDEIATALNGI